MSTSPQTIFEKIVERINKSPDAKRSKQGDFPQWMRRCFMTGKQCIFCPRETVFEDTAERRLRDSAFVIMPFRANLDTFYEWSLKPYLASFGIDLERIRRADQFSNTGYVMCEKICLRIQQAGLVVVDLSIVNANVYYEFGIAVGLNKPLLAICDMDRWTATAEQFCTAVGIDRRSVLRYPNVGHLDAQKVRLLDHVTRVPLQTRGPTTRIIAVLVRDEAFASNENEVDIHVDFRRALEAAVGVAVRTLGNKASQNLPHASPSDLVAPELTAAFASLNEEESSRLPHCEHEYLSTETRTPQPFDKIAQLIDSSLISIVDLASENALAYFWLGYCHGRNINVIPIFRQNLRSGDLTAAGAEETTQIGGDHVLAFDIRALWYMKHTTQETKALADKLAAVLEPIIVRDVTTQQRRIFWERLTRSGRVHIYNGAVHHRDLSREVVGDWDLRTASELISYLSSTDESVVPVLQSPIYAPETIAEKVGVALPDARFVETYIELVRKELEGKNCLILGSADVNPITEVVLAHVYDDRRRKKAGPECFCKPEKQGDDGIVIATKGDSPSSELGRQALKQGGSMGSLLPRRFSRTTPDVSKRGFLVDGKPYELKYFSQDQSEQKFSILAHLVVVRNPFTPEENLIVILNGVSGPATFALAEVLTGGMSGVKAKKSEALLKIINRVWAEQVEGVSVAHGQEQPRRYNGVEALLQIDIAPPEAESPAPAADEKTSRLSGIKNKFYDKRSVVGWDFFSSDESTIRLGNPRPVPFL